MKEKLDMIIAECKVCARNRGEAMKEGNSVEANKNYDKLVELLHQIRQFGEEGNLALIALTEDEDQSVRCWAATHSLKFNKRRAMKVLKKIAKEDGVIAFNAEMVIREWKKGNLKIE